MNGYIEFKKKWKNGRNKQRLGFTIATLINIKPITFTVQYGEEVFEYTKFRSLVNLDYVKKSDINKIYLCSYSDDNQILYVLGEGYMYNNFNSLSI